MQGTIKSIRKSKDNKGRECVIIDFREKGIPTQWVTRAQWENDGNNFTTPKTYVGSIVHMEFYQKGEALLDGSPCTESGKLRKEFSVEIGEKLLNAMVWADARATATLNVAPTGTKMPEPGDYEPEPEETAKKAGARRN